ncbi:MAG: carbohydrate ABC transporter permease, partial [Oscillospiraceae bacterium]|nr:carbohydrate ABC transporter permease [Oscillospiraceae bacterium]
TAYSVVLTSLGAYVLSRKNFFMRDFFMMAITFTMFFNGGLIPFYMVVKKVGLYNSLMSLIIPLAISTYNLIIMRTSFSAVPTELEEAARIDGASHWTILFKIYIPVSKAIIAVMILYYGVGLWNGWFYSMIFIADRNKFPLQLILREILIQNDTSSVTNGVGMEDGFSVAESVKYAVIVIATVPILCIYPFIQKYFVKGVMIGAVKG